MKILNQWSLLSLIVILALGCSKEVEDEGPPPPPNPYMEVSFTFTQNFNGVDLNINDTIIYENVSGNILSVKGLQYLISNIRMNDWEYNNYEIKEYHLVDVNDPASLTFVATDSIKIVDYSAISLFLGFREAQNKTGKFPDLDNKGWGWPPKWGGGYYTLKMNGRYSDSSSTGIPYDMAVGGKILHEGPIDTSYIPNELVGSMGNSGFELPKLNEPIKKVNVEIRIDVNKLFQDVWGNGNYNLVTYPGNIEEDAQGSLILSHNLQTAFSLGYIMWNDIPEEE